MSLKELTLECLEKIPLSRERKNRSRLVWWVLQHDVSDSSFELMDKDLFCNLFSKAETISRWARKHQQDRPDLRGSDYGEKELLEQETQLNLGYESGANQKLYDEKLS